jgi:hypothetical protein
MSEILGENLLVHEQFKAGIVSSFPLISYIKGAGDDITVVNYIPYVKYKTVFKTGDQFLYFASSTAIPTWYNIVKDDVAKTFVLSANA